MMPKPKLLDLFCGAGGAGTGYAQAGFDVTGVDIAAQPRYPFAFVQGDALEYAAAHGHEYDAIHASPPCQRYSSITRTARTHERHPDLIAVTRQMLQSLGVPYIIENVPNARRILRDPIMLCGTMFRLNVVRHRYFETSFPLIFSAATCCHAKRVAKHGRPANPETEYAAVTGHFSGIEFARLAMGIDWMTQHELADAIPPAYTLWLGKQLLEVIGVVA